MDIYEATETAYKNGYEQGLKDAVKHGKWIDVQTLFGKRRQCSGCGRYDNPKTAVRGHFCWNCGRKMDLED